jgi:hypothetical protein
MGSLQFASETMSLSLEAATFALQARNGRVDLPCFETSLTSGTMMWHDELCVGTSVPTAEAIWN